jgi:hypothetical protein
MDINMKINTVPKDFYSQSTRATATGLKTLTVAVGLTKRAKAALVI